MLSFFFGICIWTLKFMFDEIYYFFSDKYFLFFHLMHVHTHTPDIIIHLLTSCNYISQFLFARTILLNPHTHTHMVTQRRKHKIGVCFIIILYQCENPWYWIFYSLRLNMPDIIDNHNKILTSVTIISLSISC